MNFYTNDQPPSMRQSLRDDKLPHDDNLVKSRTFNHDCEEQLILDQTDDARKQRSVRVPEESERKVSQQSA